MLSNFGSTGTGLIKDFASSLGSSIQLGSETIGNAFSYAGAVLQLAQGNYTGAIGTAIGTAFGGPVGGAIGSFVGSALGGLFGGKKLPPRVGTQRYGSYSNGEFTATQGANAKPIAGLSGGLDDINKSFSQILGGFLKVNGIDATIGTNSLLAKKKRPEVYFAATLDGVAVGSYHEKFGKKTGLDTAFNALKEQAFGTVLAKSIQASSLGDGIKKFFDGLTKKEDVLLTIDSLATLIPTLANLPPVFDAIRNAVDTTSYKTSIADLNKNFAAVGTYTSLFYTQQEQFSTFTKQLTTQFDALDKTLPATRDGFRSLVDGIHVTDKSTSDLFNGLVALAPAADAYYKQLEAERNQLASALSSDLFSTSSDYASARSLAANGIDYTSNIGELSTLNRAGNADLIAAVKELVATNANVQLVMEAVAKAVQETARIQKIWNGDGLPETRVV
jgi:hypothetical protein